MMSSAAACWRAKRSAPTVSDASSSSTTSTGGHSAGAGGSVGSGVCVGAGADADGSTTSDEMPMLRLGAAALKLGVGCSVCVASDNKWLSLRPRAF